MCLFISGFNTLRRAKSGKPLPSARKVSLEIFEEDDGSGSNPESSYVTMMHMTFGQLLDHDITKTAIAKFEGKFLSINSNSFTIFLFFYRWRSSIVLVVCSTCEPIPIILRHLTCILHVHYKSGIELNLNFVQSALSCISFHYYMHVVFLFMG